MNTSVPIDASSVCRAEAIGGFKNCDDAFYCAFGKLVTERWTLGCGTDEKPDETQAPFVELSVAHGSSELSATTGPILAQNAKPMTSQCVEKSWVIAGLLIESGLDDARRAAFHAGA